MSDVMISDAIRYVGVDDTAIDLFESQYPVPNGVSYNAYVILDEKVAVMDTVDRRFADEWMANLEKVLAGRRPDYLVIHHLEPVSYTHLAPGGGACFPGDGGRGRGPCLPCYPAAVLLHR